MNAPMSKERFGKVPSRVAEGSTPGSYRVGIVSDTHGLLRPALVRALTGVDHIIHAGDVGKEEVLDGLQAIAPVTAVRGNMDRERWAARLRPTAVVEIGRVLFYVLHDLEQLGLDPAAAGFRAVISGHTHQRATVKHRGALYVNPGSAGPQRPNVPGSAALIRIEGKRLGVQFVDLLD
jgi:putative phosphoesterase